MPKIINCGPFLEAAVDAASGHRKFTWVCRRTTIPTEKLETIKQKKTVRGLIDWLID